MKTKEEIMMESAKKLNEMVARYKSTTRLERFTAAITNIIVSALVWTIAGMATLLIITWGVGLVGNGFAFLLRAFNIGG